MKLVYACTLQVLGISETVNFQPLANRVFISLLNHAACGNSIPVHSLSCYPAQQWPRWIFVRKSDGSWSESPSRDKIVPNIHFDR